MRLLCGCFNVLPGLEQKIDSFVGRDDALPQHEQLSRVERETLQDLLGGYWKIVEEGTVSNHRDLLYRHSELFCEPLSDGVGVADDAIDHLIKIVEGLL